MWRAAQNASRLLLAAMAFTILFFLTPRSGWISGAHAPSSSVPDQVPVDQLEDSDSCLWCDDARDSDPCLDRESERSSSTYRSEEPEDTCSDDTKGSGPSA